MHAILADIPGASTAETTSPLARVKEKQKTDQKQFGV